MSMHRTPGTILAMSRNKVKHLSPSHCFTQAREYNTQMNPLPRLHTGVEDPFPLLHIGERVFTGSLGTVNLTQHLISPTAFNMQHMRITHCQQNTHHHIIPSNTKTPLRHIKEEERKTSFFISLRKKKDYVYGEKET